MSTMQDEKSTPAMHQTTHSPTILLRSSWQTVNIGDIAHTPGLLALLKRHVPNAQVVLWPGVLDRGVDRMLARHFPGLRILDPENDAAIDDAIAAADLMLHGSGPGLEGAAALQRWAESTDKPYGIFGVTIGRVEDRHRALLERASFVFTRETASLDVLAEAGLALQNARFVPDAAPATEIRDDAAAQQLMTEHGIEEGRFLCIVPRLRKTPYHLIYPGSRSESWIRSVTELNERTGHSDHDKLLDTIVRYVRQCRGRVLLCPEMTYAVDLMDELLLDRLPDDVAHDVSAMRRFWLPDEAAAVYRQAQAVVSIECHSPLLAIAGGTPAFHLRQPEDGIKGRMYTDLGLTRCVFDIDQTTAEQLADSVLGSLTDGSAARAAAQARQMAHDLHTDACQSIASALGVTPV